MKQDMLKGLRVLVVEDEAMIAMLIEDMLTELGCTIVGPASSTRQAFAAIERETCEAAILDVNLNGERTLPVAEELRARKLPFLFATGYGAPGIEGGFREQATLTKPFTQSDLESALRQILR